MKAFFLSILVAGTALATSGSIAGALQQPDTPPQAQTQPGQQGGNRGRGMRGGMGGFGGGGVLGAVTEVAADHYTIKTDSGDSYIVHYSVNTRILKQPPRGQGRRQQGGGEGEDSPRPQAQSLKPTDIKVGDFITAGGEVDRTAKSIGAVVIFQVDPERAKQMREMEANYGKTWLAGRITAIDGTRITVEGVVDHTPHAIEVDENTSFHQRRDAITLADIKPGEQLRAEGAIKGGVFLATQVTAMEPQNREQNRDSSSGATVSQPKPQ
jgi:preprotein translocase subunit YajC